MPITLQMKITTPHKKPKRYTVELREEVPYNLAELDNPVLFNTQQESSILFELTDTDKKFQLLVLKDGRIDSVCIMIGHKREVFRQFIYGKSFLIIPFKGEKDRIDSNSKYTISK